jgi:hypothetical protein
MNNSTAENDYAEATSRVRQIVRQLGEEHRALLDELLASDSMVIGSFFEVYKTCSKPNCCCQRGEKHGPFGAISYSINGKVHHRVVRDEDRSAVAKDVGNYKKFQKNRKQLRRIEKALNEQLDHLKNLQSKEYK